MTGHRPFGELTKDLRRNAGRARRRRLRDGKALGGTLEITAHFGDTSVVIGNIGK
jgi:hypothetical protein